MTTFFVIAAVLLTYGFLVILIVKLIEQRDRAWGDELDARERAEANELDAEKYRALLNVIPIQRGSKS